MCAGLGSRYFIVEAAVKNSQNVSSEYLEYLTFKKNVVFSIESPEAYLLGFPLFHFYSNVMVPFVVGLRKSGSKTLMIMHSFLFHHAVFQHTSQTVPLYCPFVLARTLPVQRIESMLMTSSWRTPCSVPHAALKSSLLLPASDSD